MAHGFDDYRVFISAPGDLDPDRTCCHEVLSQVNEVTTMPAKVLLVPVSLRENDQITGHRGIVSDNVRWSSYFIQLFQDDWGPRDLFRKLFYLAIECREDASMPMREVALFLKDAPHERNPEILAFRKELEDQDKVPVIHYSSEDLQAKLLSVIEGWANSIVAAKAESADAASHGI